MNDRDEQAHKLLEQEGLVKREWPFEHDSEEDERLAEKADMIVGWVAVLIALGFLTAFIRDGL